MKQRHKFVCLGIAIFGMAAIGNSQTLLTFDDIPTAPPSPGEPDQGIVPNGYGGLNWDNFGVLNGLESETTYGYFNGLVSTPNVAFNEYGSPASIASPGGMFDLGSAYLTAALNLSTPVNVEVQGFSGNTMLYDNTYTVYNNAPTLIDFDYEWVDEVNFITASPRWFAMDNLTVTIVPEPGSWAIMLVATASGFAVMRRRLRLTRVVTLL
jgi:hypothetical protein